MLCVYPAVQGWESLYGMDDTGRGAKYTKGRGPVRCVYVETFASKEEAMSREFAVKHLARAEKEKLILSALRDSHIKS